MSFPSCPESLGSLPRISLWTGASPVERASSFERAIASPYPIFIKRDDAIPFAFGGNKVRKLELVLAEARAQGADCLITCGGPQSNHCRTTAAAAAKLGLGCHLVLAGSAPSPPTANFLLDGLFGAILHFVPSRSDRAPGMAALAESLRQEGKVPFVIPLGASTPLGAAGFALAFFELTAQGEIPPTIVLASSSGGTQAGLIAGAALFGARTRIVGVSADETAADLQNMVAGMASGLLKRLGAPDSPLRAEIHDEFVGEGYGIATDASREAQLLLARSEGIVVDHAYTAKALAGLIAMVRAREFAANDSILFWHTGGQVGVFA